MKNTDPNALVRLKNFNGNFFQGSDGKVHYRAPARWHFSSQYPDQLNYTHNLYFSYPAYKFTVRFVRASSSSGTLSLYVTRLSAGSSTCAFRANTSTSAAGTWDYNGSRVFDQNVATAIFTGKTITANNLGEVQCTFYDAINSTSCRVYQLLGAVFPAGRVMLVNMSLLNE